MGIALATDHGNVTDTGTDQSVFAFGSVGGAGPMLAIALIGVEDSLNSFDASAVSIFGVTPTSFFSVNSGSAVCAVVAWAVVAAGSSGNVVVDWTEAVSNDQVCTLLTFTGANSTSYDTGGGATTGSSATVTANIDCPAGGLIIGSFTSTTTGALTWTLATVDNHQITTDGNSRVGCAHEIFAGAQTNLAVTVTQGAAVGVKVLAAVSFAPAGNVYNDSMSLAGEVEVALAPAQTMATQVALPTEADLALAAQHDMVAALLLQAEAEANASAAGSTYNANFSADAELALAVAGGLAVDVALTLAAEAEIAAAAQLAAAASLALAAETDLAAAAQQDLIASLDLPVEVDLTADAALVAEASMALGASVSLAEAAQLDAVAALALGAEVDLVAAGGAAFAVSLTLPAEADLAATASLVLSEAVSLPAEGGIAVQAAAVIPAALALPAELGLAAVAATDMTATLALGAEADLSATASMTVEASLALEARPAVTTTAAAVLLAAIGLPLEAAASFVGRLTISTALALGSALGIVTDGVVHATTRILPSAIRRGLGRQYRVGVEPADRPEAPAGKRTQLPRMRRPWIGPQRR